MRGLRLLVAAALLAGCASQRVTLLHDATGGAGALAVLDPHQPSRVLTVLDEPDAQLTARRGAFKVRAVDPARFEALLGALGPPVLGFTLYFQEGSTDFTPESAAQVAVLRELLARRPEARVRIVGHTDTVGTLEDNDSLSLRRAEEGRQALLGQGLAVANALLVGRGERDPVVPTPDNVAEPRNRRLVVEIY